MFADIELLPPDAILGVTAAFRRDSSPLKVDLGVGVYRDEANNTPVPQAVRTAERAMLETQASKVYVGAAGNLSFNEQVARLALGPLADRLGDRLATIQTVGGCGALRIGAELIRAADTSAVIHVSKPTWANHEPLIGTIGIPLRHYPYYDPATHGVAFDRTLAWVQDLPAGSVVLLHGCCHNPTGADLTTAQWEALSEVVERRGLVPFVDLAYQGMGDDLDTDATGLRILAARVPELLLAISCSKNFGMYRERTGALVALAPNARSAAAIASQQQRVARRMYSMPPDHGAAVTARVLADPALRRLWEEELSAMTERMKSLRALLAGRLSALRPDLDFSWLTRHRGMFSLLGLDAAAVVALRERHHVYTPADGRINVAGISASNVDHVAESIAALMG